MKFGKHLDQALYEPWRKFYVNYKRLKDLLKKFFKQETGGGGEVPLTTYGSFDDEEGGKENDFKSKEALEQVFIKELEEEVKKVNSHYRTMEEKMHKRFETMVAQATEMQDGGDRNIHSGISRSINISCVDLYRSLNMLNNFVYLNTIGFDKIAKKFDKACKGNYRKAFEKKIKQSYFVRSTKVSDLLSETSEFYANLFENGDATKAKVRLLAKMTQGSYSKDDMCWLGIKIGIVISLVFWNLFNLVVSPDLHITPGMEVYIPLYRAVGLLISLIWMWGFNIWIWSKYRVNHVFIFEISPRHKLSHLEIWNEAASMSLVYLLNSLLFLHHEQYRLRTQLSAVFYPMALVAFIVIKMWSLFVQRSKQGSVQSDIIHSIWCIIIAPFGRARFRDCYLADYFCSMQKVFSDLQYSICFYAFEIGTLSVSSGIAQSSAGYCTNLGPFLVPLVHAIPYWFRFNQCLHRYLETHKRWPNLANAFKYTLCQLSVIIGSLHPFFSEYQAPWSPYRLFWICLIIITTLYTYIWDLILDWGLLEFGKDAQHPMLRKKRLYPKVYFYYWAIFSNLILRFLWVVTLIPFPFQSVLSSSVEYQHILLPVLTAAELFRRSQWGILRVEYEHLSTSQGFRKYKHLPLFFDRNLKRSDEEAKGKSRPIWISIEVIFMAFLLIFFTVVVWVLK
mmetsp:Transcript_24061/g.38821  ORF Transcript_24061/g.38821 Transcript_24061/m.38821 type:complete len:676 (+) Transcript_24061:242-2269(+)